MVIQAIFEKAYSKLEMKHRLKEGQGSQTEVDESCGGCHKKADTIIETWPSSCAEIKEKQKQVEKVNTGLKKVLSLLMSLIKILTVKALVTTFSLACVAGVHLSFLHTQVPFLIFSQWKKKDSRNWRGKRDNIVTRCKLFK